MKLIPSHKYSAVTISRLGAVLALLVAALFAGVGSAQACAPSKATAPAMPWMQDQEAYTGQATIVGLWHVVYTQDDGSPFNQTFKMWHSDGIEFENAVLPPVGGDICYGVWKQTGSRSVKLHHIGLFWGPDPTTPGNFVVVGTFTVDEKDTVSEDGKSYTGHFVFSQFDTSGNPAAIIPGTTAVLSGTTAAKRVNFKTPSTEVD